MPYKKVGLKIKNIKNRSPSKLINYNYKKETERYRKRESGGGMR